MFFFVQSLLQLEPYWSNGFGKNTYSNRSTIRKTERNMAFSRNDYVVVLYEKVVLCNCHEILTNILCGLMQYYKRIEFFNPNQSGGGVFTHLSRLLLPLFSIQHTDHQN